MTKIRLLLFANKFSTELLSNANASSLLKSMSEPGLMLGNNSFFTIFLVK